MDGRLQTGDQQALEISADEAALRATKDYKVKLIVIVCYGLQPSASTQNMTAAGETAKLIKSIDPDINILMTSAERQDRLDGQSV